MHVIKVSKGMQVVQAMLQGVPAWLRGSCGPHEPQLVRFELSVYAE